MIQVKNWASLTQRQITRLFSTNNKSGHCFLYELWASVDASSHLCLACSVPDFLLSSSSRLRASSSCVRGLGAGLGGMVGSWMKGWEGCTLLRSWAVTQGCTAPGRSTELGLDTSWLGAFLEPETLLRNMQDQKSFYMIHFEKVLFKILHNFLQLIE